MAELRVFFSNTFDPWFNLATEDWIFRDMNANCRVLFLWRNESTVVIGRCQNPWTECDLKQMETDGVKLARRQSGGGAVFQDLGNTNFTFLSGRKNYDKRVNNEIITSAIAKFGITALASGRNDILVAGKKISGSAFKERSDRAFHHGTLLINTDICKLSRYLTPTKTKLESKGLVSVKSRVANLSEFNPHINHENLSQAIIETFFDSCGASCEVEYLDYRTLQDIPSLDEYYRKLKDWNWRFGASPRFSHHLDRKFSWGSVDIYIEAAKGTIKQANIYSDCLFPDMIEELMENLRNIRYQTKPVKAAIEKIEAKMPERKKQLREFCTWIMEEIPL